MNDSMKPRATGSSVSRRQALSFATGGLIGGLGALSAPRLGIAAQEMAQGTAQGKRLPVHEWKGTALGAPARILVVHEDRKAVQQAVHSAIMELERIEDQFSLYRDTSALSRLNRDGVLVDPGMDMRHLLTLSRNIGALSEGFFDVTVQPLWALMADYFLQNPSASRIPETQLLNGIRRLIDYRQIVIEDRQISLTKGMALTLNGIAQGYATDRVVSVLRQAGFLDVLVELGEAYGAGLRALASPWKLGVREAAKNQLIRLEDRALAVSSADATLFSRTGGYSHILDPHTGVSAPQGRTVYVTHPSATIADALSTTICLLPPERVAKLIAKFPGTEAFEITEDGVSVSIG